MGVKKFVVKAVMGYGYGVVGNRGGLLVNYRWLRYHHNCCCLTWHTGKKQLNLTLNLGLRALIWAYPRLVAGVGCFAHTPAGLAHIGRYPRRPLTQYVWIRIYRIYELAEFWKFFNPINSDSDNKKCPALGQALAIILHFVMLLQTENIAVRSQRHSHSGPGKLRAARGSAVACPCVTSGD